eukprot:5506278-Amphidinium_carterae.1
MESEASFPTGFVPSRTIVKKMMQGAGLFLAPDTATIVLEDFRQSGSMPEPTSSSAARGPTSVRSFATELVPPSQVHWIQSRLQAFKVRSPSSDLPKDPGLTILRGSGASLAPGHETPGSVSPGHTRVPTNSRGELNEGAKGPSLFKKGSVPGHLGGGPATPTLYPPVPSAYETSVGHNLRVFSGRTG